jgi:RHS repeat-associated protein
VERPSARRFARRNGAGWRYRKEVTNSGDRDRTEYFYYDNQWRLLEARNDDDLATRQYVWGTQYIDELICIDVDTNSNGDCTDDYSHETYGFERYRPFQDANWNVVGIWAEHAGQIVERYEYDAYGASRVFKGWDADAACEPLNVIGASLIPGGNPIRYAGYYYDDETGLYHVRHRMYSPGTQRWMQRDGAEYVDGPDLYAYVLANPVKSVDPKGLATNHGRCYIYCMSFFNYCGTCKDRDPIKGVPGSSADCAVTPHTCLDSCKQTNMPYNPIILGGCSGAPSPPGVGLSCGSGGGGCGDDDGWMHRIFTYLCHLCPGGEFAEGTPAIPDITRIAVCLEMRKYLLKHKDDPSWDPKDDPEYLYLVFMCNRASHGNRDCW